MQEKLEREYRVFETEWFWFAARRNLIRSLLKSWGRPGAVLDVGCGSGDMCRAVLPGEATYYGIDVSKSAIESGCSRRIGNLVLGDINKLPFSFCSFDTILLLDVLEHLDDETLILQEINRILKANGKLVLLSPAFNFLWGPHDVLNRHRKRYRKGEIEKLLLLNNFESLMTSYWNASLFLPAAILKKTKAIFARSGQEKPDFVRFPAAINSALTALLGIENRLVLNGRRLPFGTSIFCVARKK